MNKEIDSLINKYSSLVTHHLNEYNRAQVENKPSSRVLEHFYKMESFGEVVRDLKGNRKEYPG
jgi:hypothetical protein